jgi:DNA modification methylase
VKLLHGDCRAVLPTLEEASVDACVTDPPYGLEFMGKGWDGQVPGPEFWSVVLRVLKPGAYLLAFGGTRTYHRMACAVEDAGFRIQDCLSWMYGQGFPKGKTQLKPAWEPILLAYKPGKRTLNVDECRIDIGDAERSVIDSRSGGQITANAWQGPGIARAIGERFKSHDSGRWPANVLLDEEAAAQLDEQSGERPSAGTYRNPDQLKDVGARGADWSQHIFRAESNKRRDNRYAGDTGGASRFFYTAKANAGERHYAGRNTHPTVKPVDLMRWLVRLVTPPGGLVLDPFTGSGSTGVAALAEGRRFLGIEREAEYVALAQKRIAGPMFAEALA